MVEREPILFCFCGPVASGKSTITRHVLTSSSLALSISTTTRKPRPKEKHGVHYYFLKKEEFLKKIEKGDFIEYAEFNNNFYGTDKKVVRDAFKNGVDLLLDIEVKGVKILKSLYPENVVTIFVIPPSIEILKSRLIKRKSNEGKEEIEKRLKIAKEEIKVLVSNGFSDYLLVNDDLDEAKKDALSIIRGEKRKFSRYSEKKIISKYLL